MSPTRISCATANTAMHEDQPVCSGIGCPNPAYFFVVFGCPPSRGEGDRWEATFSGYCNRQFVYEVKMKGRQVVEKIVFTGKADLGDKDGGLYYWTGELADGRFKGRYKSESGKTGLFEMKPVTEAGK